MLDSVTLSTVRPLLSLIVDAIGKGNLKPLPGWRFWWTQNSATKGCPTGWNLHGQHDTGLYVWGHPYEIRSWTTSLPGLLHGFNGIQLKSDADIQQSRDSANTLLNEVSFGSHLVETIRRLDVA